MTILAVDDSRTSLAITCHMVESFGWDVSSFTSPAEALEFARSNPVTLAITDFNMPGMDGISFFLKLRDVLSDPELPVVMVTGTTDSTVRYRALEAGVSDFLRKPLDGAELKARLRNLFALRRSAAEARTYAASLETAVQAVTARLVRREQEIILRLSRAAEFRDTDTGSHIVRMATYCRILAKHIGLGQHAIEMIFAASPMHDIGKMAISDNILHKPGPLTPEERRTMETHTLHGYSILKDSDCELLQLGAEIALNHHERWDGKGYPNRLAGEAIPISARIAAVADVFDALTTERPYKRAWTAIEARDFILKEAGQQFDPQCVAALLAAWHEVLEVHEESRSAELPACRHTSVGA